jgi:hypothetical protein
MKKYLVMTVLALVSLLVTSCNQCSGTSTPKTDVGDNKDASGVLVKLDVDHLISTDRQSMYMNYKDNYRWYETEILLPEFMDSDNATSDPEMVVNILQSIVEEGNGADVWVHKFQHFKDGTFAHDSIQGFWIENYALNDEVIKLNYTKAWDRMMATNLPKPHSRHVTLRNPIGPVAVNTQWIFGNISEQIWIDAVTGEAKNSNPAFPKEKGFKMPLGEWP